MSDGEEPTKRDRAGPNDGASKWFPADDGGLGLFGLVIGVGFFFLAGVQATSSTALIPGSEHTVIQGTFYPRVVSVLIVISSAALVAVERLHVRKGGEPETWMLAKLPLRVVVGSLGLLALVGVVSVLLEPLGFVLPSAALAAVLARLFGAPSWVRAALTGVIVTVVVYLLFTLVFDSPLPPLVGF